MSRSNRTRSRGVPVTAVALCLLLIGACRGSEPISPASSDDRPSASTVKPWLVDVTREAGLETGRGPGNPGEFAIHEIMASGAALLDVDGDGALDIYLTNVWPSDSDDAAVGPRNRLYRQIDGGRFEEVTEASGLADAGYGMGVAVGDIDNDGDVDLYLAHRGPDQLYRNRGDGTFENRTADAGVDVAGWSSSAAFFDYDLDGWLDLYVVRYVDNRADKRCTDNSGRRDYCSPKVFPAVHDVLLRNNGDGTFRDVSQSAGIREALGAGLGVVTADFNEDGRPDVYVANDAWPNQLWINGGDGTFRDRAVMMGAAYNMHGRAEAGMGILVADLDNDLQLDLFMTHLSNETNTFYRNLGAGNGFEDATGSGGLATSSLPYTGFGTAAVDFELDGDLDLVVVNGRVNRGRSNPSSEVGPPWDVYAEPQLVLLNRGGANFEPAGAGCQKFVERVEISRGLAAGDIDNDGDLDLLLSNVQSGPRLYRNEAPRKGHWLIVTARDPRYRRDAIGARVTVEAGAVRRVRTIGPAASYQSSGDFRAHFGLGAVAKVDQVEVLWPDGLRERFRVVGVNRECVLERGAGESLP